MCAKRDDCVSRAYMDMSLLPVTDLKWLDQYEVIHSYFLIYDYNYAALKIRLITYKKVSFDDQIMWMHPEHHVHIVHISDLHHDHHVSLGVLKRLCWIFILSGKLSYVKNKNRDWKGSTKNEC